MRVSLRGRYCVVSESVSLSRLAVRALVSTLWCDQVLPLALARATFVKTVEPTLRLALL